MLSEQAIRKNSKHRMRIKLPVELRLSYTILFALMLCAHRTGFTQEKSNTGTLSDIAYTAKHKDGTAIFLLSKGKSKQLTSGFHRAEAPAWSPDGKEIIFSGCKKKDDAYDLFKLHFDMGKVEQLTSNKFYDSHPSWSPKGNLILFASNRENENLNSSIFLMNTDGSNVRKLKLKIWHVGFARWLRNGNRIGFSGDTRNGRSYIYSAKIDGTDIKQLTDGKGSPSMFAWSPDGKKIAFASNRHTDRNKLSDVQLFVMKSDGTDILKITDLPHQNNGPDWSHDGKRIVFYSIKVHDLKEFSSYSTFLYVANADGTGLKKLTGTKADAYFPRWRPQMKK